MSSSTARIAPEILAPAGTLEAFAAALAGGADAVYLGLSEGFNARARSTAFDLATKSYNAKKSASAAFVIANAACKMKDAGKAKKAIARLKGQSRDEAISICASNGITIE